MCNVKGLGEYMAKRKRTKERLMAPDVPCDCCGAKNEIMHRTLTSEVYCKFCSTRSCRLCWGEPVRPTAFFRVRLGLQNEPIRGVSIANSKHVTRTSWNAKW